MPGEASGLAPLGRPEPSPHLYCWDEHQLPLAEDCMRLWVNVSVAYKL